jgi:hypothetical protein
MDGDFPIVVGVADGVASGARLSVPLTETARARIATTIKATILRL